MSKALEKNDCKYCGHVPTGPITKSSNCFESTIDFNHPKPGPYCPYKTIEKLENKIEELKSLLHDVCGYE